MAVIEALLVHCHLHIASEKQRAGRAWQPSLNVYDPVAFNNNELRSSRSRFTYPSNSALKPNGVGKTSPIGSQCRPSLRIA
jgi:hypothetical protein